MDGIRQSVYLADASQKQAQTIRTRIEHLVNSKILGTPIDQEIALWVDNLSNEMNEKLADVGLVTRRETSTLAKFIDDCLASRSDWKQGTRINLTYCRDQLVFHFGADRPLHLVTRQDALVWLEKLKAEFAPATASRVFRRARQYFNLALKQKLIRENPFADIATPQRRSFPTGNDKRRDRRKDSVQKRVQQTAATESSVKRETLEKTGET